MGTANIVFGYVGSGIARDASPLLDPVVSEALSTSTTSAQSAANTLNHTDAGGRDLAVRVYLSEAGWVWVGPDPTATKTTAGIQLAATTELYLTVAPGDKVAVLDDA